MQLPYPVVTNLPPHTPDAVAEGAIRLAAEASYVRFAAGRCSVRIQVLLEFDTTADPGVDAGTDEARLASLLTLSTCTAPAGTPRSAVLLPKAAPSARRAVEQFERSTRSRHSRSLSHRLSPRCASGSDRR